MITVLVLMTFYDENGLHKAGSITKVKESDFNPDYMKKLNPPSPGGSTELSELDDVDISDVTDGEILTYDAATEKWVNSVGGGGGSVITNIFDDGDGHVESMDIDGTTYEFGTGETTIDLSAIQTDSNGKVSSMDIDGQNCEFTSVENVSTDDNNKVSEMSIDGNTYEFGTGTSTIENISTQGPNGEVDSMDIDGQTYSFATGGGGGLEVAQASTDGLLEAVTDGTDYWNVAHELQDLEDVDLDGQGDVLVFNGDHWTNGKPVFTSTIVELRSRTHDKISEIPVNTTATFECYQCEFTTSRLLNGEPILFYDKDDNIYYSVAYFDGTGKLTLLRQNNHCYEVTVASEDAEGHWQGVNILRVQ